MRKALVIALASLLVLISCASMNKQESLVTREKGEPYELEILCTSDMHGNIWGFSYEDGKETANNGMTRLYSFIKSERETHPNLLLLDAGDDIQGTIMTDDLANKNPKELHPVIAAMNYMKYDAMTLGNHEFNWGISAMKDILKKAEFPALAANVKDKKGKYVTGAGTTIINRDGVKVAVIGVTTPNIPIWDGTKEGIEETTFESAPLAVKAEIAKLPKDVDIIIVSAHMGTYGEFDEEGGSDAGLKILEVNPEVDVLQVAHNHTVVKEEYNGVPVVGVRNGGRDIARVVLALDGDNNIVAKSYDVIDMKDTEPALELRDIPVVKELHNKAVNYVAGVGENGEKGEPLGTTTAKFQPENEIVGLPEGKLRDTPVMDLINMIQLEVSGADVSACALFKDTSDLPEGDITYGNIFDIYKFDNTLYRVPMTGKEIKNYMEWAAACYNQWMPGDINISFDPDHPGYLYDMFAGVDYEIDLSQPAGSRIKNVMFKGEPLKDDAVLKVAVNNYRYSSALRAQGMASAKKEWESSNSIRDMIVDYFAKNSPVTPKVDNNWKIVGVDLCESDPRRAEIISLINEGKLPTPYNQSYNLKDYDALIKQANETTTKITENNFSH